MSYEDYAEKKPESKQQNDGESSQIKTDPKIDQEKDAIRSQLKDTMDAFRQSHHEKELIKVTAAFNRVKGGTSPEEKLAQNILQHKIKFHSSQIKNPKEI